MTELERQLIIFIQQGNFLDTFDIMKALEKKVLKCCKKCGGTIVKNLEVK